LAILHVLRHEATHLSPSDVYKKARKELPSLTEPTVYRTLEFLTEFGLIRSSHSSSGHLTYEIAEDEHHHVICRVCGADIELEHSLFGDLYQKLEKASGFKSIGSHITFFGVCPTCQKQKS